MQKGQLGIFVLLGVILIFGVVSGAFYLGRVSTPQSQPQNSITTSQTTPTSTPVTDETANWKTYTNSQYNFSLKYPFAATVKENVEAKGYMTDNPAQAIKILLNRPTPGSKEVDSFDYSSWFELTITVENNPNNLTPDVIVKNYLNKVNAAPEDSLYQTNKSITNKVTNSLKNYSNGEINGLSTEVGVEYTLRDILMTKKGKLFSFIYTGDDGQLPGEKGIKMIDILLSTFKFLE